MPSHQSHATPERRERVLATLRTTANVSEAARRTGVARMTLYRWREADPDFAAAWDDAVETAIDDLEATAWERARYGTARPIVRGGEVVGEFRQHSDGLLMFLLRARRPERYRADATGRDHAKHDAEQPVVVELLRFDGPDQADGGSDTSEPAARPGHGVEGPISAAAPETRAMAAPAAGNAMTDGDTGTPEPPRYGTRESNGLRTVRRVASRAVSRGANHSIDFGPPPVRIPGGGNDSALGFGRPDSFEGMADWEQNWA